LMGLAPTGVVLTPVPGAIEYRVFEADSIDDRERLTAAVFLSFCSGRSNRFDQSPACVFFAFLVFFEKLPLDGNLVDTRAHLTFMS